MSTGRPLSHILSRGEEASNKRVCMGSPSAATSATFSELSVESLEVKQQQLLQRERALREVRRHLAELQVDAFVLSTGDAHLSEFVCEHDGLIAFLSGFTGSSATIAVTQSQALLWTDGRYFLQAAQELASAHWTLMKMLEPGVPGMPDWVAAQGDIKAVGVDAYLVSAAQARQLEATLGAMHKKLTALAYNPVGAVWGAERPPLPCAPAIVHPLELAGYAHTTKIAAVQSELSAQGARAVVVSALDEVAWLLNLRGADIQYNPVLIAYAVVAASGPTLLFVDARKLSGEVVRHLEEAAVRVRPYAEVEHYLAILDDECMDQETSVLIDETQLNWGLALAVRDVGVHRASPLTLPKSVKNAAELDGIRAAHLRDGAALTAFLAWLDGQVRAGASISEHDVAVRVEEFRGRMPLHRGPSFATIAGYGTNGAVIHYKPKSEGSALLGTSALFLLDSGAQYLDGTTDVTRTLHFGSPSAWERRCFTLVLKGHIALARLVFPEHTLGSRFDCVCRVPLWTAGLDYNHGTGHGVGAFLNVHEGPQGIGFRKRDNEAGFVAGMTTSNEPGYYEEGAFGIRIETVCIAVPHPAVSDRATKRFCALETVTLVPLQRSLIDASLLSAEELDWVNAYHARVRSALEPLLTASFPEALPYLIEQTECIVAI